MAKQPADGARTSAFLRLLREPTLHFFAIAAAALLVQRAIVGDADTIELTAALKADLVRRYQDQIGRPPTPNEIDGVLANWKTEEILYREALRARLDRDDPAVRNLLVGKMRDRLLLQTPLREPSDAELQQFLEQHRADYEIPLLYEHEFLVFPKQDPDAAQQRAKCARKLAAGATPASLGLRSTVANVNRERIAQEFGPALADQIPRLPVGEWRELETNDRLLLVKLNGAQGGLAPPAVLHEQLLAGWKANQAQKLLEQATQAIAQRYRLQDKTR
ncbi:MAG TPA: peptidylprolyl isomerase [Polyangiaceae bacterium]|nr:peptidylprolyl isomerase [Polyangiaceae bacterium]